MKTLFSISRGRYNHSHPLPSPGIIARNLTLDSLILQADFRGSGPQGPFISNIVSQGRDATDLYLTFYFEWPYPQIEEGSDEAKKTSEKMWSMAREAVAHTIDVAREMVKEGKVGA